MCGIAGVIGNDLKIDIQKINKSQLHRGPDFQSVKVHKDFIFFHSLLKIMDLSDKSHQPIYDQQNGNCIIFNGSIYNYKKLRSTILKNEKFSSDTDTEVLLKLYKIFGYDLTRYLKGMFVFAIFDKSKNKILIFRDWFGIKPLFYSKQNNNIYFASEIKTLIKFPEVEENLTLNQDGVIEFIGFRHLFKNSTTLFKNIKILPKESFFEINLNNFNIQLKKYEIHEKSTKRNKTIDKKAFEELFLENINYHKVSQHKKIACLLSGGVDSSILVSALNKNLLTKNIDIHTYIARDNNSIEIKNAIKINKLYNLKSTYLPVEDINFFDNHKRITKSNDQPLIDCSIIVHNELCAKISKDGFKILFSGNGADEIFYGYPSHIFCYFAKLLKNNFFRYVKEIIHFSKFNSKNIFKIIFHSVYENFPLIIKNFFKRLQVNKRLRHLKFDKKKFKKLNFYENFSSDVFENIRLNYLDKWGLQTYLDYEDKNAMQYSIETRVPYLDIDIYNKTKTIELHDFFKIGTKSVIRNMSFVPDFIKSYPTKEGFAGDMNYYLKRDMTKIVNEIENEFDDIPFINKEKLLNLSNTLNKGNIEFFFRTYSYGIWYNIFFKKKL
jgi:asparagine synthase (glutamine-hydrolysing)